MRTPVSTQSQEAGGPDYLSCMNTCEACVVACLACMAAWRTGGPAAAEPLVDATVCVQACELALHAMTSNATIAAAACGACARCCEGLALQCMLLPGSESRQCARACYRAARECHRVAQSRGRTAAQRRPGAALGETPGTPLRLRPDVPGVRR